MKNIKMIILGAAAAAASLLAACSSGTVRGVEYASSGSTDALDNTTWEPIYVKDAPAYNRLPNENPRNNTPHVSFNSRGWGVYNVTGMGGVNRIAGRAEVQPNGEINFSGMASTMMAGPNMEFESRFTQALTNSHYMINSGSQISLYDYSGGQLLMTLRQIPNFPQD